LISSAQTQDSIQSAALLTKQQTIQSIDPIRLLVFMRLSKETQREGTQMKRILVILRVLTRGREHFIYFSHVLLKEFNLYISS